ncbi:hypothetical protein [Streptomyces sp. NBC_01006]|uniref:hypothetical protein n=1 Tax=Streptomyces sp. NBC_01006 TaxID=2903716 RepID=UPI00386B16EC|nr:hypothetical protein OG509_00150 [Streptomyces sp. NBC_01006]
MRSRSSGLSELVEEQPGQVARADSRVRGERGGGEVVAEDRDHTARTNVSA